MRQGRRRRALAAVALLLLTAAPVRADPPPQTLTIGFVGTAEPAATRPPSPLEVAAADEGVQGARLAVADNETTGRFIGQAFRLQERLLKEGEDAGDAARAMHADGIRFVVADLPAAALLAIADAAGEGGLLVFNARAADDRLRNEDCRGNVLHTALSRAMQADGLAQYLAVKDWRRWFLVRGPAAADALMADAFIRAAKRFGHRVVAEKVWTFSFGPGRADSGHVALQSEIPTFTRPGTGAGDYDVLIVADEANMFGEYLPDRTFLPRPVAGTQGLTPVAWSPVHEQWGASQLQDRFRRQAGRAMTARDYAAWLAVRAIGEAAVRTRSLDPERIGAYLRGPEFVLAGFKGQGLSFRAWDGQLRQPVLLAGPKLLVSVSPQPGFLHERSELDSLGDDQGDSRCRLP